MKDKFFKALGFDPVAKQTNVKTEIIAGIVTFLAMAYILTVNPAQILVSPDLGAYWPSVFIATALGAIIGTLLMAFFASVQRVGPILPPAPSTIMSPSIFLTSSTSASDGVVKSSFNFSSVHIILLLTLLFICYVVLFALAASLFPYSNHQSSIFSILSFGKLYNNHLFFLA